MSLITHEQVVLDLTAPDRHDATRILAERLVASGRCTDLEVFLGDVRKREETMATGLPGGIGIPHARSAAITTGRSWVVGLTMRSNASFRCHAAATLGVRGSVRQGSAAAASARPRPAVRRTCRCSPNWRAR